jgi:TolA-binding protein
MRPHHHLAWLVPFLAVAAVGAQDLPQPRKDPSAPARLPDLSGSGGGEAAPSRAAGELQRLLDQLRAQREALRQERTRADRQTEHGPGDNEEEMARLRRRMNELMDRLGSRTGTAVAPPAPPPEPGAGSSAPPAPGVAGGTGGRGGTSVIDPVALAQNLFQAGEYAAALEAYRRVPLEGKRAEERMPVRYMIATCLRKLGKTEEAAAVYREVAGSKGDEFTAECARWQLNNLTWKRDIETQLAQLRQRRKALEPKP